MALQTRLDISPFGMKNNTNRHLWILIDPVSKEVGHAKEIMIPLSIKVTFNFIWIQLK